MKLSIDGINNGVFNDPHKVGKGYKLINVIDLYQEPHINIEKLKRLNLTKEEFEKFKVEQGDIFFTRSSLKLKGIAHCNININSDEELVYDCHLMRVRPNQKEIIPKYLSFYCLLYSVRKYFMARAKQTTMTTISQSDIKDLKVLYPPIPEQQKIVEILSTWDRAIDKMEKLIEAKTQRKKALMQQLLTGKKRFNEFENEKWRRMKLGELLVYKPRPVDKPKKSYWALGIRSHGKGTFKKKIEEPEKLMMDTLYEVKKDDLIVNITFAWEGAIAITKKEDEGLLVSHRFPTYVFKQNVAASEYFKQVILTKYVVHKLGIISPGGAGRNRVLSKRNFLRLQLKIPSIKEQQKIASVLGAADEEIELLTKQLDAVKKQKRGLMQKLLTGKIRVKL